MAHDRTEIHLEEIGYGPDAVVTMIEKVLLAIPSGPIGEPGPRGHHQTGDMVLPALAAVKHEAFCEEREWRLLLVTDERQPLFRTGTLCIIPYIEVEFDAAAMVEVVLGPGPNSKVRRLGVERLLRYSDLANVKVMNSAAPFRP